MLIFCGGLIWSLVQARRSRKNLMESLGSSETHITSRPAGHDLSITVPGVKRSTRTTRTTKEKEDDEEFTRTTIMLLLILIIFIVAELPKGILSTLECVLDDYDYYMQCYDPPLSFVNTLEHLANSVPFFIYMSMSRQFRSGFFSLFKFNLCTNK